MRRLRGRLEAKLGFEVVEIEEGSLGYLRRLTRGLARGGVVCTAGVGTSGYKFVAVEFLGAPAYFSTGPASLARMAGVPLLPVFTFEDRDGTDHVVVETPIDVPSEAAGDAALVDVIGQYARLLERYVRAHAEQWLWWHAFPIPTAAQLAGRVIGRR
jgi:KDO2-lipid IV(A) lauroyltransferase